MGREGRTKCQCDAVLTSFLGCKKCFLGCKWWGRRQKVKDRTETKEEESKLLKTSTETNKHTQLMKLILLRDTSENSNCTALPQQNNQ